MKIKQLRWTDGEDEAEWMALSYFGKYILLLEEDLWNVSLWNTRIAHLIYEDLQQYNTLNEAMIAAQSHFELLASLALSELTDE